MDRLLQLADNQWVPGNLMDNLAQLTTRPTNPNVLPLINPIDPPLKKSPFLSESPHSRVLLIEDDLMNIEAMRRLMLQFNLELSWATSGSVAL